MPQQEWLRVITLPGRSDFSSLNQWLLENRVGHRFTLEGDSQILWVDDPDIVEAARVAASEWMKSDGGVDGTIGVARHLKPSVQFNQPISPLTLILVFFSFVGFALASLGINYGYDYSSIFLFYERPAAFTETGTPWYLIQQGEIWRAITPIFLHFGLMHIIFNALWLWFLGSRVESVFGPLMLLLLVLFMGLVSNIAQAWVSFPTPFGGMSGVVHGLLAYVWLVGKVGKDERFYMPPALFPVMVVFMLVSSTGIFDRLLGVQIADTAHMVGFVSGLFAAGITLLILSPKSALVSESDTDHH